MTKTGLKKNREKKIEMIFSTNFFLILIQSHFFLIFFFVKVMPDDLVNSLKPSYVSPLVWKKRRLKWKEMKGRSSFSKSTIFHFVSF